MRFFLIVSFLVFTFVAPETAKAQTADPNGPDHEQLHQLLISITETINQGRFRDVEKFFYKDFAGTVITQDVLTSKKDIDAYFDKWFSGDSALIKSLKIAPEADALSRIYDDKFATVYGSNIETYELTNGKIYEVNSRWTASLIKDQGTWKILTVHNGVNFLDNPVLTVAGQSTLWFGAGGLLIGFFIGLLAMFLFKKRKGRNNNL
ncbi:MAG: hypothetical protein GY742_17170 [Hyphomicrobiales bacterium]|nr:hypothetical protein [Hyphomicrobiales bacterium]